MVVETKLVHSKLIEYFERLPSEILGNSNGPERYWEISEHRVTTLKPLKPVLDSLIIYHFGGCTSLSAPDPYTSSKLSDWNVKINHLNTKVLTYRGWPVIYFRGIGERIEVLLHEVPPHFYVSKQSLYLLIEYVIHDERFVQSLFRKGYQYKNGI